MSMWYWWWMRAAPVQSPLSALDEAIRHFVPLAKFAVLLEQHRERVLTLKARGASHAQIHDLLKQHGIVASEPAIGRFCRKHRDEVKRINLLLEREGDPATSSVAAAQINAHQTPLLPSSPATPNNSIAPHPRKIRDLRGEV